MNEKEKIDALVTAIGLLTPEEGTQLRKAMEERFSVKCDMPKMQRPVAVIEEKEVQTEFTVTLVSCGSNKMPVLKQLRDSLKLSLQETKTLVDSLPQPIGKGLERPAADALAALFSGLGAELTIS